MIVKRMKDVSFFLVCYRFRVVYLVYLTYFRGGNVLIADLGMLQIKSELQPKDNTLEVNFQFIYVTSRSLVCVRGVVVQ